MLERKWTLFRPSVRCQAIIKHSLPFIGHAYGFAETASWDGLPHVIQAEPLDGLRTGNSRLRNDWMESCNARCQRETASQRVVRMAFTIDLSSACRLSALYCWSHCL
jgi:hypothetical protein